MLRSIRRMLRPVRRALRRPTLGREFIAKHYLSGSGIEIGALHKPLRLPRKCTVKYVDRMSEADLKHHYAELGGQALVHVDIIDDGERLGTIAAESQQFVVANHFIEHSQDPTGTLKNMTRVLKPGGIIFMALPDKRYTFDVERQVTPLEHLLADHANGPAATREQHFAEWVTHVTGLSGDAFNNEKNRLMDADYSIHFHTWTLESFLQFLLAIYTDVGFEIELCMQNDSEIISVLRKKSPAKEEFRRKSGAEGLQLARPVLHSPPRATQA